MDAAVVEVRGLVKAYGGFQAVKGIDLSISEGEVFALLGPNGAGKTTTVEILEGHRHRDAGEVSVLGFDPARGERAFKSAIGIVLQETSIDRYLTVAEAIELFRGYYPRPLPTAEVIELVGLSEKGSTRISRLSGGQQRRLDMALGLVGDPRLVFLDEPTTGFDPAARRAAWDVIRTLRGLGKTILLTTHYLDEAQALADRVAIVKDGLVVAEGPPSELSAQPRTYRVSYQQNGTRVELETDDPTELLHRVTGEALARGQRLEGLSVSRPTL